MNCPIDNSTLLITDRNGIEIDYCPKCRGVWLDRGELDKIIEKANNITPSSNEFYEKDSDQYNSNNNYNNNLNYKGKKKKSFFDDLFDF